MLTSSISEITFGMRSSLLYFKETDVSMPICVVLLSGLLDKNLPVGIVSTDVTAFGMIIIITILIICSFNAHVLNKFNLFSIQGLQTSQYNNRL